jgi:hypothetical protein
VYDIDRDKCVSESEFTAAPLLTVLPHIDFNLHQP